VGVELGVRRNVAGDVHGSGRGRGAGSDERRWRRPAQVQEAEEVADAAPVSASSASIALAGQLIREPPPIALVAPSAGAAASPRNIHARRYREGERGWELKRNA